MYIICLITGINNEKNIKILRVVNAIFTVEAYWFQTSCTVMIFSETAILWCDSMAARSTTLPNKKKLNVKKASRESMKRTYKRNHWLDEGCRKEI